MKNAHTPHKCAPSFRLDNVTRCWGERVAVKNLSLAIEKGQTVALVGPSGGGKSTLIRMLAGVLKPSAGAVYIDNRDLADFSTDDLRKHRAACRIVEQSHLLVPQITVHQNVIAGQLSRWPWYKTTAAAFWPVERGRVRTILDSLGIGEHQWRLSSELSGGQMQRVAIGRALISEPAALLADEPTASLDPVTARSVTETILTEAKRRGVTLVFCTHWLDVVKSQCDRVLGLRDGALVLDSDPSAITQEVLDYLYEGSCERI